MTTTPLFVDQLDIDYSLYGDLDSQDSFNPYDSAPDSSDVLINESDTNIGTFYSPQIGSFLEMDVPKVRIHAGRGNDALIGNNNDNVLIGGAGDDFIDGGLYGNNILWGGSGNDQIIGGEGNDTLMGGWGYDYMSGGAGDDLFTVHRGGAADIIDVYEDGIDYTDTIEIHKSVDGQRRNLSVHGWNSNDILDVSNSDFDGGQIFKLGSTMVVEFEDTKLQIYGLDDSITVGSFIQHQFIQ